MHFDHLVIQRFVPSVPRAPGGRHDLERVAELLRDCDVTFARELGELLAASPTSPLPPGERIFLSEVDAGVQRRELRLADPDTVHFPNLEATVLHAVERGSVDLVRWHRGGVALERWGRAPELYLYFKASRFRSLAEEWRGPSATRYFTALLAALHAFLPPEECGRVVRYTERLTGSNRWNLWLEGLDEILENCGKFQRTLQAAEIPWSDWQKAGRGWRARLGFDTRYF